MNIRPFHALFLFAAVLAGCTTVPAGDSSAGTPAPLSGTLKVATGNKSVIVVPDTGDTSSILTCPGKRIEYTPIPALAAGGYTDIVIDGSGKATAQLKAWPREAVGVNALLTNISTNITQSVTEASGGAGGLFSASHSRKQYVIDFMKWRAEPLTGTNNAQYGWVRVGAGIRLIVNITRDDGSASGGLLALAVNAKAGKIDGSISTELIGMDAKEVTQAMPFTVDLSEGNIQKVVEALAIVKAKLYDNTTTLHPNLIARIECAP